MAKKKESAAVQELTEAKVVMVTPDQLKFDVPNPRFAGIEYDIMDPEPYGDAIEKMGISMIETYRNTGVLLMQPIVATYKGNNEYTVRAGYTRALAFVLNYEEMQKALGVDNLKIAVSVMENINIVDALMENVTRTEQHFITIANAICQAVESGKNIPAIATQIGIPVSRAIKLKKIGLLGSEAKRLCFEGIINEKGAAALADYPEQIQQIIVDKIIELEIEEDDAVDEYEVVRLYERCLPEVPKEIPLFGFTDLEGNEHPDINKEPWYINIGDMFGGARTSDKQAMIDRGRAYWETVAKVNDIKIVDRYNINYDFNTCEMGTHPEEVAFWHHSGAYLMFAVKASLVSNSGLTKEMVDKKKQAIIDRVNKKINSLKEQRRKEVLFEQTRLLMKTKEVDMTGPVNHFLKGMYLNSTQKEAMSMLAYKPIEDGNDLLTLPNPMEVFLIGNMMAAYGWFPAAFKMYFETNGVDIDKKLKEEYESIESTRDELMEKAEEKVSDMDEDVNNTIFYIKNMMNTFVFETGNTVYDSILHADEPLLRHIGRMLNIPYKGTEGIMRTRIKNAVDYIIKSNNIEFDPDNTATARLIFKQFMHYAEITFFPESKEGINGTMLNDNMRSLCLKLAELGYIKSVVPNSFDIKKVIKTQERSTREKEFIAAVMDKVNDYFTSPFAIICKSDKGKYYQM